MTFSAHLLIGGAGAVGKSLIKGLLEQGDKVIVGLRNTPLPKDLADHPNLVLQKFGIDVRRPEKIDELFVECRELLLEMGISRCSVWNLAAPLSVDAAADPNASHAITVGGMRNILEGMCKVNAANEQDSPVFTKLLFTDSIGSFGCEAPRENVLASWLPANPNQDPGSDYGRQKRECRNLMDEFSRKEGLDTRWAVLPGVLHTNADWGNGTTEYALDCVKFAAGIAGTKKSNEGSKFSTPIDPDVPLPMIYSDDLVCGLMKLHDAEKASLNEPERGYNIVGFSFTGRELYDFLKSSITSKFEWEHGEVNDIMNKFANAWPNTLSNEATERDIAYKPQFFMQEVVKKIFDAHMVRGEQ